MLTKRLVATLGHLIKFVPLKKTTNSALSDIDLEVASHKKCPHELEIYICKLRESFLYIQRSVEFFDFVLQAFMCSSEAIKSLFW